MSGNRIRQDKSPSSNASFGAEPSKVIEQCDQKPLGCHTITRSIDVECVARFQRAAGCRPKAGLVDLLACNGGLHAPDKKSYPVESALRGRRSRQRRRDVLGVLKMVRETFPHPVLRPVIGATIRFRIATSECAGDHLIIKNSCRPGCWSQCCRQNARLAHRRTPHSKQCIHKAAAASLCNLLCRKRRLRPPGGAAFSICFILLQK